MNKKVVNVILIEDDKAECAKFERYIRNRDDVNLLQQPIQTLKP